MTKHLVRHVLATGSVLVCASFWLTGCGCGGAIAQSELDRAAHSKPPTAEQWSKVTQAMAQGAQDGKAKEKAWAAAHPEEAKRINAERASVGRPPLGQ